MMKRKAAAALMAVLLMMLCGCGKQPIADRDGNMLEYQISEIPDDGFYVHDIENDTFTPVMNGASGYTGEVSEVDSSRYIWFGSNEDDLINLTPEIIKGKKELIAYYESEDSLPESVIVEGYRNLGYTLGVQFVISDDGKTLSMDNQNVCESSEIAGLLSGNTAALLPVGSINDSDKLPLGNVDRQINMLLGLQKDKYYKIGYYDGTVYQELTAKADTMTLKMQSSVTLTKPYEKTTEGYFRVILPANISDGYYYINGDGVFAYRDEPEKKSIEGSVEVEKEKEESK